MVEVTGRGNCRDLIYAYLRGPEVKAVLGPLRLADALSLVALRLTL